MAEAVDINIKDMLSTRQAPPFDLDSDRDITTTVIRWDAALNKIRKHLADKLDARGQQELKSAFSNWVNTVKPNFPKTTSKSALYAFSIYEQIMGIKKQNPQLKYDQEEAAVASIAFTLAPHLPNRLLFTSHFNDDQFKKISPDYEKRQNMLDILILSGAESDLLKQVDFILFHDTFSERNIRHDSSDLVRALFASDYNLKKVHDPAATVRTS